jgi:nitrilase
VGAGVTPATVRVAAVQASPVALDRDACVDKAIRLIGEAAAGGAELAVFSELFVPVYTSNSWASGAASYSEDWDELYRRYWEASVEIPGPEVARIVAACAEHGVHCVIGVSEREADRSASLYNSMLTIGPGGILNAHRKLVPTHHEKVIFAAGDSRGLTAVQTPSGRVGGLICYENRMPLARYAVYRSRPEIWVAPTADGGEGWMATVRHIAIESGAFVVSVPAYVPRDAFPDDMPIELPDDDPLERGGAAVIEPGDGSVIAGPVHDREAIVYADLDLHATLAAKRVFDSVGNFARDDELLPALTHVDVSPSADGA